MAWKLQQCSDAGAWVGDSSIGLRLTGSGAQQELRCEQLRALHFFVGVDCSSCTNMTIRSADMQLVNLMRKRFRTAC